MSFVIACGNLCICPTAVSLNEDIDTNKELVGHGYSNLLAGLVGTVYVIPFWYHTVLTFFHCYRPNYLVYINTLLSVVLFRAAGRLTRVLFLQIFPRRWEHSHRWIHARVGDDGVVGHRDLADRVYTWVAPNLPNVRTGIDAMMQLLWSLELWFSY